MAPINLPDGSEASAVTMPDGTEASGVRDPDGNVVFSAIPDSVVSRPDDNGSNSGENGQFGVRFTADNRWAEIGGRISGNSPNELTAYIYRVRDAQLVGSTDISGLSPGDTFTITLSETIGNDGEKYNFVTDADGSNREYGFYNSSSFPYTSTDGNLSIINGASGADGTLGSAHTIDRVGDVGF